MDINPKRNRNLAILIVIAFFVAVGPTLPWQEFSSGPENLVLATAMETRRGGPWLVPTLQGEPRLAKPPLSAWITAKSIWAMTMKQIDILDPLIRQRAYFFLAIEARWPALLAGCGILLGIFALGKTIRDSSLGLIATAVGASSYFLFRFSRYATTDIDLAVFVTWANVFLAQAILRRQYWRGFIGAGIALGLAMMSKGPVALVESVVPMTVYAIARRFSPSPGTPGEGRGEGRKIAKHKSKIENHTGPHPDLLPEYREKGQRPWIAPFLLGLVMFVVVGLGWFILVFVRYSHTLSMWYGEISNRGEADAPPDPVATYLGFFFYVLPWTVFFVVGIIVILQRIARRVIDPNAMALMLAFVPLIVMTFSHQRQDRYALPMIAPAAVVIAIGVLEHLRSWKHPARVDALVLTLHWLTLAGIAVAFPIIAATRLIGPKPWLSMPFAIIEASLGALLVLAGIMLHCIRPSGLVSMTFITMLIAQMVIFKGYCQSPHGLSDMKPMAELLAGRYPDALFFNAHPTPDKRPPTDLGVYLNRTILWTGDPAALKAGRHPLVLFMLQNKGQPQPAPPPGWEFADKAKLDKDWWWAFVLPPP